MTHEMDLLLTLGGGLGAALVLGLVAQRLRLPAIVGYLLAGVAVGPFTPGFVAHRGIAGSLAELGVILLMFGVGLHFDVRDLVAVRKIVLPWALVPVAAAAALAGLAARSAGFAPLASVVFGLSASVTSTVVLLRVLADHDALTTRAGHLAVAWLLVEDVFTVLVLVLLPILAGAGAATGAPGGVALSVGVALLKLAALVAFALVVGRRVIPRLFAVVARTRSRELFTLTVLVVALGLAVGAAELFGASMALGAFLAGVVVGQSEFGARAASEALPMRDAFAVLFFVSVGMLFDPSALAANARLVALVLVVAIVVKPLVALVVALLLRQPPKTAASLALGLAPIGEFSFLLAALGVRLGVLPEAATQALVVAALVSIPIGPLAFRQAGRLARLLPAGPRAAASDPSPAQDAETIAIVVGHGPVGRTLARLLTEAGVTPVVVEMNHETVERLRAAGVRAIHGDASRPDILEAAGVARAAGLVITASGSPEAVLRAAREVNPTLDVLARATYVAEVPALRAAGATAVVSAEGEVALGMAERLLEGLGATGDQLDRARARVRAELAEPDAGAR